MSGYDDGILRLEETVYNIAGKKPELVGEIVIEKIQHLSNLYPDYEYQSVSYLKDAFGGMICHFKFRRK